MNLNSCYYHPNLPASIVCNRCGRRICDSCRKPYNGLTLCPTCYHAVPVAPMAAGPVAPIAGPVPSPSPTPIPVQSGVPVGGFSGPKPPGWYGPYVQIPLRSRWWVSASLVAIAGSLIIAQAAALLSPSWFATWATIMPWIVSLGSFNFILGVVLGLILLGSIVMIYLKFKVLAAFVIFPTSIVSIFIGGGFFIGAILGVLAGIILLL